MTMGTYMYIVSVYPYGHYVSTYVYWASSPFTVVKYTQHDTVHITGDGDWGRIWMQSY